MVLLPPPSPCGGGGAELSVAELRAVSLRQQQQLSWQQQQLVAREQRLRFLRQAPPPHEPQELKLRRLRAQLDQQQAGNASLAAELESVRALFAAKEQELSVAAAKVEELTRQLEELRKSSSSSSRARTPHDAGGVRGQRAAVGREQRQQAEAQALDRRIAELRQRLHKKRLHNSQQQQHGPAPASAPPQHHASGSNVATVEPRPRSDPKYQTLPYNTKFRAGGLQHHSQQQQQAPFAAAAAAGGSPLEEQEHDHKKLEEEEEEEEASEPVEAMSVMEDPPSVSCSRPEPSAVVDGAHESSNEDGEEGEEEDSAAGGGEVREDAAPAETELQRRQQQQRPGGGSPCGPPAVAPVAPRGNLRQSGGGSGSSSSRRRVPQRVSFDPLALLLDAALEGELDLVRTTVAQVPNPSAANDEGITALHNAICAGHLDIVKFLVQFGCDVNAQDSDGWTPLHCAASCNNLAMVRFLVEHGACVFAATLSDHETAADKCEEDEEGFDSCSQYLYGVQEKLGVSNGGMAYAVFDYEARQPDELSFRQGDLVQVLRREGGGAGDQQQPPEPCVGWWWARLLRKGAGAGAGDGREEGYLPRNLLGLYPRVQPCRPSPEG